MHGGETEREKQEEEELPRVSLQNLSWSSSENSQTFAFIHQRNQVSALLPWPENSQLSGTLSRATNSGDGVCHNKQN